MVDLIKFLFFDKLNENLFNIKFHINNIIYIEGAITRQNSDCLIQKIHQDKYEKFKKIDKIRKKYRKY